MKLNTEQIKILKKLTVLADKKGNLPNATIIIDNGGKIIGQSQSLVATNKDATAHAERLVIEKVCKASKSCVIPQYKLISVFEPCLMCLSAAFWAGIKEVYYIIPASKYWNEIPWTSESKKINKQDLILKFSEKIKLENAMQVYLEVCYLDLNGPNNRGGINNAEILRKFPAFDSKMSFLAPAVINRIRSIIKKLKFDKNKVESIFLTHNLKIKESLKLPLSPEKCWQSLKNEFIDII